MTRLAGDLLDDLCRALRQSPDGGIALLKDLEAVYPKIPKVFYSRKATLRDAKEALAAGALDIISKPEPNAHEDAAFIAEQFKEAADLRPPRWGREWLSKGLTLTRDWGPALIEVAKMFRPSS